MKVSPDQTGLMPRRQAAPSLARQEEGAVAVPVRGEAGQANKSSDSPLDGHLGHLDTQKTVLLYIYCRFVLST